MTTNKHDDASSARDFKPCPFCGGKAKLITDGLTVIMCSDCDMTVSNHERSIIKLTDQWNMRISNTIEDKIYKAISEPLTEFRVEIARYAKHHDNKIETDILDKELYMLENKIWKKVHKELRIINGT